MAIRVLLDHGVPGESPFDFSHCTFSSFIAEIPLESHIIFLAFLISRHGLSSVRRAFPSVQIVTAAIDTDLFEMHLPLTSLIMGEAAGEADFAVRWVDDSEDVDEYDCTSQDPSQDATHNSGKNPSQSSHDPTRHSSRNQGIGQDNEQDIKREKRNVDALDIAGKDDQRDAVKPESELGRDKFKIPMSPIENLKFSRKEKTDHKGGHPTEKRAWVVYPGMYQFSSPIHRPCPLSFSRCCDDLVEC